MSDQSVAMLERFEDGTMWLKISEDGKRWRILILKESELDVLLDTLFLDSVRREEQKGKT